MRLIKVIGAFAGLALALTGCGNSTGGNNPSGSTSPSTLPTTTPATPASPSGSASTSATPTVQPSAITSLDAITVTDNYNEQPNVSAPYPFKTDTTLSKVIVDGNGPAVPDANASVELNYVGIDARSGQTFDSSFANGQPVVFPLNGVIKGFASGLVGKKQGSRVLVSITSSDAYDPGGNPQAGIFPGDTLLFVVDLLRVQLAGPLGASVPGPADMPTVSDTDGKPSITIPADMPAPTQVKLAPLVQGTGRALAATDAITSHSVCKTWDGNQFYNDFDQPAVTDSPTGTVMQSLFTALVGQKEGSRVLVVLPGNQAFPNGNPQPSIAPNTAIACVVDVLFTQAGS